MISSSFAASLLFAVGSTQETTVFIPPFDSSWDSKVDYTAVSMPDSDLESDATKFLFSGKFWVDGLASVTAASDGQEYLWIEATVHAPQLPNDSFLVIFGQLGQVEQEEEVEDVRRLDDGDAQVDAAAVPADPEITDTPVSTFLCWVEYVYLATTKDQVSENSKWTTSSFTGPSSTVIADPTVFSDYDAIKAHITSQAIGGKEYIIPETATAEDQDFVFWGNDASKNTIEVYKDKQFINTCSMWRKLKRDDVDDGAYNLTKESNPMANFGYLAYGSDLADPDNIKVGFNVGEAAVVTLSFIAGAMVSQTVTTLTVASSILLLTAF